MPFEDQLGESLRRTGESFRPDDRSALVDAGLRRGRRTVRRRRTATVTGSVVALALVGFGGAYASGVLDLGGGQGTGSVGAPAKPKPLPAAKGDGHVSKEQVLRIFKSLLPEGKTSQEIASGSAPEKEDRPSGMPSASVVFDDGDGKAQIGISFNAVGTAPDVVDGYVTCPSKAYVPYDRCATETLADGSRFMVVQGYEYPDKREPTKNWRATLVTPKGVLVDMSEYNAPAEKGAQVSRDNPPLTATQLKAFVTAKAWAPVIADLKPVAEKSETPRRTDPSAAGIQKALIASLPGKLAVTDKGGQEGFGFVVVDDGKGASLVQINVQNGMDDVFPRGDVTTLPDGTVVGVQKGSGEKVADQAMWTADAVGPDGFRVVISAFNTGSQTSASTREEPALTLAELKAIAIDAKWRKVQ
ncbi:hypothetical protein [Streptomyces sp. NBC_01465]|uniref:hypothetical protein n=1 Tax=Streptomyces sp. NBC_01465 TaxID=2903878 RepID=UPI002E305EB9|nr:hypothetical protein [Streptomyces sp. NBC_01465]